LSYPSHRPFFCDPTIYPSPPKTWDLLYYANDSAIQLASGFYRTIIPKSYPGSCIEFCDIEALESYREDSSDGSLVIHCTDYHLFLNAAYVPI
jgi:hypothetical protein